MLRNGAKADLVLFNPDLVDTPATFDDPQQYPVGIDYVCVNGVLVIDNRAPHRSVARPRVAEPVV